MNLNQIFELQKDGKIICKKYDHNEPLMMVLMDKQIPTSDRLLCQKCYDSAQNVIGNSLPYKQALNQMKDNLKKQKDKDEKFRSDQKCILQKFLKSMKDLQTKIEKNFKSIETQIEQWIKGLEKFKLDEIKINLVEDIKLLHDESIPKLQLNIKEMTKINKSHFTKIELTFKKLSASEEILKCFEILKQYFGKEQEQQQLQQMQMEPFLLQQTNESLQNQLSTQIIKENLIKVELIKKYESKEWLAAIAFNFTGTVMASVSANDIKLWKFYQGQMGFEKLLEGHTNYVNCLLFSKKEDWLASAGDDNNIRLWKKSKNDEWISKLQEGHKKPVVCLIWCRNEEQLISCGEDCQIIVWQVNYLNNEIKQAYTLEKKHTDRILSIDINDNETALVSCSQDKQIILWKVGNNGNWQFQNKIETHDDYGCRICFISENMIIRQRHSKGDTEIFEIKNEMLSYLSDVNLNEENCDHYFFPTIRNQKQNIIVQSHNKYVYILRRQGNDLKLITDAIDCVDKFNYGAMTLEGDYLAIWNYETKEISIYNLIY